MARRPSRAAVWGGFCVAAGLMAGLGWTTGAEAKSSYDSPYGFERTWNAALRLVRVDNGWKVTEKDERGGYLLFEYLSPENAKPAPGSFELVRGRDDAAPVSVVLQIPRMPHYHEQMLIDALASKMRREYGEPAPVRRREAPDEPNEPESPDDAGTKPDGG